MEEIITVDGKQFKLTTDRPLTAEQKVQTIAEIRKQTGCGTCGPGIAKMGSDWQYGGVKSLAISCPAPTASGGSAATAKSSGQNVSMTATPVQGVAPYTVEFRRANPQDLTDVAAVTTGNIDTVTYVIDPTGALSRLGTGYVTPADPINSDLTGLGATGSNTGIAEGTVITRIYKIDGTDINEATSKGGGQGASLIFASKVIDSCATPQTCVNACKIFVACPAPVCDFTVS